MLAALLEGDALSLEGAAPTLGVCRLTYKGAPIGEGRIDLLVENRLIIELKAVDRLAPIHHAQVMSYLKASKKTLGLLINFNVEVLRDGIKRIILT